MKIVKEIKTSQDINVVLQIFSDPTFTIPKIFPGVTSIKTEGGKFEAEGKLLTFSYKVTGRAYVGIDEIKYVYDTDKGKGTILTKKER